MQLFQKLIKRFIYLLTFHEIMKKKRSEDRTGLFIPAGLFIGMGVGFIIGQLVGGIFLGLGLGFFGRVR